MCFAENEHLNMTEVTAFKFSHILLFILPLF